VFSVRYEEPFIGNVTEHGLSTSQASDGSNVSFASRIKKRLRQEGVD